MIIPFITMHCISPLPPLRSDRHMVRLNFTRALILEDDVIFNDTPQGVRGKIIGLVLVHCLTHTITNHPNPNPNPNLT